MRAIAEVATAVTKGDLTRSIQVDARGEVAELKDNINTMIDNLRLTTDRNTEQDWLKTNLARVTGMLQGQRDLTTVGRLLLNEMTELVEGAAMGVIYQMEERRQSQTAAAVVGACRRCNGLKASGDHADIGRGARRPVCASTRRRVLIVGACRRDAVPIGSAH